MQHMKFLKILKIIDSSKIVLIVLGFLLTTVIGERLVNTYQEESWKRDVKYEFLRQEIEETRKVLDDVIFQIENRRHMLQKVYWALEIGDKKEINECWNNYTKTIDDWNINNVIYKNKIRRLIGEELANEFLDNEKNLDNRNNVHTLFVLTHNDLRKWKESFLENESKDKLREFEKNTHDNLRELAIFSDDFINKAYLLFIQKYKTLENNFE